MNGISGRQQIEAARTLPIAAKLIAIVLVPQDGRDWFALVNMHLVVINQRRLAGTHVVRLYQRIKRAKNHQKAVVAVARHLAEATWWVLTKQPLRALSDRASQPISSR